MPVHDRRPWETRRPKGSGGTSSGGTSGLSLMWIFGMGLGALMSLFTFMNSSSTGAPQQAVVGVWSLYYLILPYTCCRAVEAIVREARHKAEELKETTQAALDALDQESSNAG